VFRKEEYETEGQQYVDLELFLLGIQHPDCLPLLKKNHVTLEILFTMREQDLQQIGILEVALQKKILAAVASIHRKEWDMPQNTTHVLSSSEAVMAMSHLKKHIQYLQATCHLLIKSMNHNHSTYWRMDSASTQELFCEARNLDSTVSGLQKKVSQLKDEVQRVADSQCSRSRNTRHTVAIMCVTCFVYFGFYLWWKS
ncbi:Ankyrin repeat, SAM and basic leucine zipper domain-containing protein 1, partial [Geodia barretti]